jgi:dCMP deaminase
MRIGWKEYFMVLAKVAALRSGCNSRPTGSVIVKNKRVISTGYNGSLPGQWQCTDKGNDFCYRRRTQIPDFGEDKYRECLSIHGEQNSINQLSRFGGVGLEGSEIYCTLFPCIFCMKNIASVGITKIYYEMMYESDDPERDQYWFAKAEEYELLVEQIQLSEKTVMAICSSLVNNTSERRL